MDQTPLYQALYDGAEAAFESLLPALGETAFLFVPGLLADLAGDEERFMAVLPRGDCFGDQVRALERAGTSVGRADLAPGASVAVNGRRVAEAIARINRAGLKVVLISHGKGGLDTLEALLSRLSSGAMRFTARQVAGWIAIQTPFQGTPLADDGPEGGLGMDLCWSLRAALPAGLCALKELAPARRQAYLAEHADAIGPLLEEIPLLTVASRVEREASAHPMLRPSLRHLLGHGIASDGLVSEGSARLPGSDGITLDEVDHLAPISGSLLAPEAPGFDRVRAIKALAATLLGPRLAQRGKGTRPRQRPAQPAGRSRAPAARDQRQPGYMLSP